MNLTRGDVGHLYFPRLLVVLALVFAVAVARAELLARRAKVSPTGDEGHNARSSVPAGRMTVLSLLFVALLPLTGFLIASASFLWAATLLSGRARLWQAALYAGLLSVGVWWLFARVLGVPLP